MPAEGLDDLRRFVLPQQPVVDEDARQLVADCLVHEHRGDCGVDAARQRAEHALPPHLRADAVDLLLDHRRRRPGGRRRGDLVEEVLEHGHPVRRVDDLGVELHAVQRTLGRLEGGNRRRSGAGDDPRALGRRDDGVAVRHPHGLLARRVLQERRLLDVQVGLAELRDAGAIDAAAEVERHQLHAVTDAERRDAELEDARVDVRRVVRVHRRGAAAQDHRVRVARAHGLRRDRVADELGVDAALAHATRDQLRVLAAEVDNEHRPVLRSRERHDVRRLSGDSSAPLS